MPILPPGVPKTFQLAPGETLSITTDSASVCRYAQLTTPPGSTVGEQPLGSPIAVPVSSVITVGPLAIVSRWLIDGIIGPGCVVVQSAMQSVPDVGAPSDLCHL